MALNAIFRPGSVLVTDGQWKSTDGRTTLILQGDGNLVIYRKGIPIWQAPNAYPFGSRLVMEETGNLALYTTNNAKRWESATDGNPGAYACLQNNGNFAVCKPNGTPVWQTSTGDTGGPPRNTPYSSSHGPALSHFNGKLYLAWKDRNDSRLYCGSSEDGISWTTPFQVVGAGTSHHPTLAPFEGRLYLAWKNDHNDSLSYTYSEDGQKWENPRPVSDSTAISGQGPALASFSGRLCFAWKKESDATLCVWFISREDDQPPATRLGTSDEDISTGTHTFLTSIPEQGGPDVV